MAGISSKAAGKLENKKKYNGIEFDKDLGINTYEAFYRNLDPQTGRWWQIDPKTESMEMWSPYVSMFDNPILKSDPLGDEPDDEGCCGFLELAHKALDYVENKFSDNKNVQRYVGAMKEGIGTLDIANDPVGFMVGNGNAALKDLVNLPSALKNGDINSVFNVVGGDEYKFAVSEVNLVKSAASGDAQAQGRLGFQAATFLVGGAEGAGLKKGLPNNANVVRGGTNSAELISKGIGKHPGGVTGFSVECGSCSVKELAKPLPHGQIGVTTVGDVRKAGGNVIKTSGRSSNHATVTGLSPQKASELLTPTIKNPNIP